MRFATAISGNKAMGLMSTKVPDDGLLAPGAAALVVALEQAAAAVARHDGVHPAGLGFYTVKGPVLR
jgi:hypothetical protein